MRIVIIMVCLVLASCGGGDDIGVSTPAVQFARIEVPLGIGLADEYKDYKAQRSSLEAKLDATN